MKQIHIKKRYLFEIFFERLGIYLDLSRELTYDLNRFNYEGHLQDNITDEALKTAAQMFMYITAPHQIYWKDIDKLYSNWIQYLPMRRVLGIF